MKEFKDDDESEGIIWERPRDHDEGWLVAARDAVERASDDALDQFNRARIEGAQAADGDLTSEDLEAVRAYTRDELYVSLNRSLREGTLDQVAEIAPDSAAVTRALENLPEVQETVYRGIDGGLTREQLDRYEPGTVVIENNYTSASLRPDLVWGDDRVRMVIQSEHGRLIGDHSSLPSEREVLFDRFSTFEVVDRHYDEDDDRWTIRLNEVR